MPLCVSKHCHEPPRQAQLHSLFCTHVVLRQLTRVPPTPRQVNLAALDAQLSALAGPAPRHISPTLADICALLGRPVAEHAADAAAALVAEVAGEVARPKP